MTMGRPRTKFKSLPKHIDADKIPQGLFWRGTAKGGVWYRLVNGKRENVATEYATLSELFAIMECAVTQAEIIEALTKYSYIDRNALAERIKSTGVIPEYPPTPKKPCCHATATPLQKMSFMILCKTCGNKRCPRANDCNNECTGSNDVGQVGSAWENVKPNNTL